MECPEVGRARAGRAPAGPQRSAGPGAAGLPGEHACHAGGVPFTGMEVVEHGERVAVAGSLDVVAVVQPGRQLGERSPGPPQGWTVRLPWRSSFDRRGCRPAWGSPERRACVVIRRSVRKLLPRSNASLETSGSTRLSGIGIAFAFLSRLAPVLSLDGHGRDRSRRCRWLSRCVAARDASAHPVHVAFVTKHAWTPWKRRWIASGCLLLWACGPNGVLPGPPGSTSRA